MLSFSIIFLLLGVGLLLYGFYIHKKPYLWIKMSSNLSKKMFSDKDILLYTNKISRVSTAFGIFYIISAFPLYLIDNLELSLMAFFTIMFYPLLCFYYQKILTGKIPRIPFIFTTLIFIGVIISFYIGYIESKINIDNHRVIITGIYNEKIPINQLNEVFLADTLPAIKYKTNGFSTGRVQKGYFYSSSLGKNIKLFLHSYSGPYLYIIYSNNKYAIVNFRKKESTLQAYEQIKETITPK